MATKMVSNRWIFYKLSEKKHDHLLANGAKFLVRRGNILQGETNSTRVVSNYVWVSLFRANGCEFKCIRV